MAAINMNHFDILEFVKKAKDLGMSEQVAEFLARQIENAINVAVNLAKNAITKDDIKSKDLATKVDIFELKKDIQELELKIERAKNQTLLLLGTFGVFFLGILAKGFHWL